MNVKLPVQNKYAYVRMITFCNGFHIVTGTCRSAIHFGISLRDQTPLKKTSAMCMKYFESLMHALTKKLKQ